MSFSDDLIDDPLAGEPVYNKGNGKGCVCPPRRAQQPDRPQPPKDGSLIDSPVDESPDDKLPSKTPDEPSHPEETPTGNEPTDGTPGKRPEKIPDGPAEVPARPTKPEEPSYVGRTQPNKPPDEPPPDVTARRQPEQPTDGRKPPRTGTTTDVGTNGGTTEPPRTGTTTDVGTNGGTTPGGWQPPPVFGRVSGKKPAFNVPGILDNNPIVPPLGTPNGPGTSPGVVVKPRTPTGPNVSGMSPSDAMVGTTPSRDRCAPPIAQADTCYCFPDSELCPKQGGAQHPDLIDSPFGASPAVLVPVVKIPAPPVVSQQPAPVKFPAPVRPSVTHEVNVKGAGELPLRAEFVDMSLDHQVDMVDSVFFDDEGMRRDLNERLMRGDFSGVFDALAVKSAMVGPAGALKPGVGGAKMSRPGGVGKTPSLAVPSGANLDDCAAKFEALVPARQAWVLRKSTSEDVRPGVGLDNWLRHLRPVARTLRRYQAIGRRRGAGLDVEWFCIAVDVALCFQKYMMLPPDAMARCWVEMRAQQGVHYLDQRLGQGSSELRSFVEWSRGADDPNGMANLSENAFSIIVGRGPTEDVDAFLHFDPAAFCHQVNIETDNPDAALRAQIMPMAPAKGLDDDASASPHPPSSCARQTLRLVPVNVADTLIVSPFDDERMPSRPQVAMALADNMEAWDGGSQLRAGMKLSPAAGLAPAAAPEPQQMNVQTATLTLDQDIQHLKTDVAAKMGEINNLAASAFNQFPAPVPTLVLEAGTRLTDLQARFGGRLSILLPDVQALRTGNSLYVASKLGGTQPIDSELVFMVNKVTDQVTTLIQQYGTFYGLARQAIDAVRARNYAQLRSVLASLAAAPLGV